MPKKKNKTETLRDSNGRFTSLQVSSLHPPITSPTSTPHISQGSEGSAENKEALSPKEVLSPTPKAPVRRRRTASLPSELVAIRTEAFPDFDRKQPTPVEEKSLGSPSQKSISDRVKPDTPLPRTEQSSHQLSSLSPLLRSEQTSLQQPSPQHRALGSPELGKRELDLDSLYSASPLREEARARLQKLLRKHNAEQEPRSHRPGYVYVRNHLGRPVPKQVWSNAAIKQYNFAQATNPTPAMADIVYSKRSWKMDATLIVVLFEEMERGGFPHLTDVLTDADFREARAIVTLFYNSNIPHYATLVLIDWAIRFLYKPDVDLDIWTGFLFSGWT
ncbi:hypothetical protein V8E51_009556 [Hyaloscypha variabilis]